MTVPFPCLLLPINHFLLVICHLKDSQWTHLITCKGAFGMEKLLGAVLGNGGILVYIIYNWQILHRLIYLLFLFTLTATRFCQYSWLSLYIQILSNFFCTRPGPNFPVKILAWCKGDPFRGVLMESNSVPTLPFIKILFPTVSIGNILGKNDS